IISGTVYDDDARTGTLAGAIVTATPKASCTAANGQEKFVGVSGTDGVYSINVPCAGNYTVTVMATDGGQLYTAVEPSSQNASASAAGVKFHFTRTRVRLQVSVLYSSAPVAPDNTTLAPTGVDVANLTPKSTS